MYVMFIIEAFKICLLFFYDTSAKHVLLWNSAISWAIPILLLLLKVKILQKLYVLAIMHTEMALLVLVSLPISNCSERLDVELSTYKFCSNKDSINITYPFMQGYFLHNKLFVHQVISLRE